MSIKLSYFQKKMIIEFILFGSVYSLIMWMLGSLENVSSFLFLFTFYGGLMTISMNLLERGRLKKLGIFEMTKENLDEDQMRIIPTAMTKEQFDTFWKESDVYNASSNEDGSYDISRKYYTTEFKLTLNVSYRVEEGASKMVLRSKPKRWFYNDIALIHKSINAAKEYGSRGR